MKAFYFSSQETSPLMRKVVDISTRSLSAVSPELFAKLSFKIFMKPRGRRNYDFNSNKPEVHSVMGIMANLKPIFLREESSMFSLFMDGPIIQKALKL